MKKGSVKKSSKKRLPRTGKMIFGPLVEAPTCVRLVCRCGAEKYVSIQPGVDIDIALDNQAIGWYTCLSGVVLCPVCIGKKGHVEPGLGHRIHHSE